MRDVFGGSGADVAVWCSAAAAMALVVVGVRHVLVQRMAEIALRRLDDLQGRVDAWQAVHAERMKGLERRITAIERATARVEDDARVAATAMRQIRADVLLRIEGVEQRAELEMLVAEGRIPPEHVVPDHRGL